MPALQESPKHLVVVALVAKASSAEKLEVNQSPVAEAEADVVLAGQSVQVQVEVRARRREYTDH